MNNPAKIKQFQLRIPNFQILSRINVLQLNTLKSLQEKAIQLIKWRNPTFKGNFMLRSNLGVQIRSQQQYQQFIQDGKSQYIYLNLENDDSNKESGFNLNDSTPQPIEKYDQPQAVDSLFLIQFFDNYVKEQKIEQSRRYIPEDPFLSYLYSFFQQSFRKENKSPDDLLYAYGKWKSDNISSTVQKPDSLNRKQIMINKVLLEKDLTETDQKIKQDKQKLKEKIIKLDKIVSSLAKPQEISQDQQKDQYNYSQKECNFQFAKSFSDDFFQKAKFVLQTAKAQLTKNSPIYIKPQNINDAILPPMEDDQKVAIIGDWGTGLRDSLDLLEQLVVKEKATVIIHLGDTYYTGSTQEQKNITKEIQNLRQRTKTNFRFYLTPGNHDYYRGGGAFYEQFKHLNKEQVAQTHSFFCLRNKSNTFQIIGMDTGKNGCKLSLKYIQCMATKFQQSEVKWAKDKINNFKGQTILITHHLPFSAFQPASKDQIINQTHPQISNLISEQLFDVIPKISCWIWGHEHRFAMYKPSVYGIPLCRLVGNSGWQNSVSNSYKEEYAQYDITIKESFPKQTNGYFWLTGMTIQLQKDLSLFLNYINMECTYKSPSKRVNTTINESIVEPKRQKIKKRQAKNKDKNIYFIKDSSGLSYRLYQQKYIWLDYVPTSIQFIFEGDELQSGAEVSLYVPDKQKYIVSQNDYLTIGVKQEKFILKKLDTESPKKICTGDTLTLKNKNNGKTYSRKETVSFISNKFYKIGLRSDQKEPEFSQIQIYDPKADNRVKYTIKNP